MLGQKIREARKLQKLTQEALAEKANIAREQVNRYEKEKLVPDFSTIKKIAEALELPLSYFVEERLESPISPVESAFVRIPVLGAIPAGIPFEAIQNIEDYEDLPETMANPGAQYFGLRVKGDSMEPEYLDGDTIILQRAEECRSGDDCAVMVNGDDATFKRVRLQENGLTLQPLNHKYEPRFFTAKEVRDLPVRIVGICVEVRRRIRRK